MKLSPETCNRRFCTYAKYLGHRYEKVNLEIPEFCAFVKFSIFIQLAEITQAQKIWDQVRNKFICESTHRMWERSFLEPCHLHIYLKGLSDLDQT